MTKRNYASNRVYIKLVFPEKDLYYSFIPVAKLERIDFNKLRFYFNLGNMYIEQNYLESLENCIIKTIQRQSYNLAWKSGKTCRWY